ncbi:programmed cell death 6-interacting protein [Galendromus occidentalis]|uniref:Programmed cell death 6-interacting protein n=1 Tax=Galendromus occidentalis TaxID=34638 RepID=A0AAJ6QY56_9ACAR|nr:programmed cell death 6-interacting protein [Galendromus occidentalis]
MAGYLAIPLKKTSEVDLIKPLTNIFSGMYTGSNEKEEYTAALTRLNSMRKSATWKTLDKHQASVDAMATYYDQLCALESKIPVQDVQVHFKWKDAFNKGGFFGSSISLTLMCLGYEKSCILFNYGAMLSQIAAGHGADISDDESLKTSTKYFQMAAGVYHHLRTFAQTVTQESLTADLHPDTLTVLYTICLAQAQEGFYHKATKDGKKDSLLAQVASQCEDLYADALKLMSRDHLRCIFEKDWFTVLGIKEHAFKAVTHYHKALQARADKEVGEELARLQVALENFRVVQTKMQQNTTVPLGDHFLEMLRKANRYYEDTKKDNDFIYHARIPEIKQLGTIRPAAVAKAIALSSPLMPVEKRENLFDALLPISVSQGCQKVEFRRSELVTVELSKLKQATQVLNGVLASLNLPAAIEDVAGGAQLPPSIQRKAQEVKDKGGLKALEAKMNELGPQLQRNREIVEESKNMLDDEERSDQNLKNQFKEKWTRLPSSNLNQPMRETLKKYTSIIDKAVAADKVVQQKFQAHRYAMVLLGGSESELSGNIPQGPVASAGNAPETATLKTLMQQVEKLGNEREVLEHEIKSTTLDMKDQFLQALAADGAINETAMTAEAIGRAFGPLQERVKESLETQETLIVQIQSAHQEFMKRNGGGGDKREDVLKNLAAAHSAFTEIMGNLDEGLKFYGELTILLLNHQTKINDFCFARKTEKEELVKDLTKSLAGAASLPAGSAVPSQPPTYQTNAPPTAPSTTTHEAPAQSNPSVPLPYPQQPQGMPQPFYAYPSYPMYQVPMPGGYNPYAMPPGYQPPYNAQQPPYMQYPGQYHPPPPPQ